MLIPCIYLKNQSCIESREKINRMDIKICEGVVIRIENYILIIFIFIVFKYTII